MKLANLLQSTIPIFVGTFTLLILGSLNLPQGAVNKISMDMSARSLFKGQAVYGRGTVYYSTKGGLMVTKMDTPIDQVVMVTGTGEYKAYDRKSNTVQLMQGLELSSKGSFIYSFLNGKTEDMGLEGIGFKLTNTHYDDGVLVKTFVAPVNKGNSQIDKAEVAYENNLPIFIGFFDANDVAVSKTYYTNYQSIGIFPMPMTITEINFLSPSDSTISQKKYSNVKINAGVSEEWLNFIIPADAQIVSGIPSDLLGQ
ncbi:MAG: hypothetical protein R2813_14055 [Flavobacteriales bacterium]